MDDGQFVDGAPPEPIEVGPEAALEGVQDVEQVMSAAPEG